jgi:hypothetical protein
VVDPKPTPDPKPQEPPPPYGPPIAQWAHFDTFNGDTGEQTGDFDAWYLGQAEESGFFGMDPVDQLTFYLKTIIKLFRSP